MPDVPIGDEGGKDVLPDKEFDSSEYLDRPDPQYEGDTAAVTESEEQTDT